jgi:hypothetical protein
MWVALLKSLHKDVFQTNTGNIGNENGMKQIAAIMIGESSTVAYLEKSYAIVEHLFL